MSKPTPAVYTIMVWWMHGWPIGRIASWSGKTTGTIRGITTRAYSSPSRAEMTQAERQAELNRLKLDRLDGGRLKDEWFIAIPIHGKRVASIDGGNIDRTNCRKKRGKGDYCDFKEHGKIILTEFSSFLKNYLVLVYSYQIFTI